MADPSMPELQVFQALWAMEDLDRGWSPVEGLERIAEAGFAGVEIIADPRLVEGLAPHLDRLGLARSLVSFPDGHEALGPVLDLARAAGACHVNVQGGVHTPRPDEAVSLVRSWRDAAREAGVPVFFETHRDRLTNDIFLTLDLIEALPDITLTIDLSHYVVGRDMPLPMTAENDALMRRLLDRSGTFHGRVSSGSQVQVSLAFPRHRPWVEQFARWWEHGFRSWRRRFPEGTAPVFLCELGPPDYAITGPDGKELSDRWEEALLLKAMAEEIWRRSGNESGAPEKP
jgi:hypothetical protein